MLDTHLRTINEKQVIELISNPFISVQGQGRPELLLSNSEHKAGTHPGPDALPSPGLHTRTHSDWDSTDRHSS